MDPGDAVTQLLGRAAGDPAASARLLSVVYDELRAMARNRLKGERDGHTLQATALVHEAYLRLLGGREATWANRAHFFGACANAMRQILVEHARQRNAQKRGGGAGRVEFADDLCCADTDHPDLVLQVDEALEKLRAEDARAAQVVELRFFAGLEMAEVAAALDVSERTAHREWTYAKARLVQLFGDDE